uniref:Indole-3-glycerol phosphate synthase n=1 Tax=Ammonifex degensii TaxID=42838 RepID=A0A7C2I081_9THEO
MLGDIVEYKRAEIARRKATCPPELLVAAAHSAPPPRDFRAALRQPGRVSVIAEIKRASPSKGLIRPDADPVQIARIYTAAGAAAISVLTEERFFKGRPEFLRLVRRVTALPLLYKDFVIDPYQIYEARQLGADAVLLIVRILRQGELTEFLRLVRKLKMEALVETHTEEEIKRALTAGASIIGINNRDLKSFTTDIKTTFRLKRCVPPEVVVVSESGISSPLALRALRKYGVDAALIGEALMAAPDIEAKLRELVGAGRSEENGDQGGTVTGAAEL